MKKTILLFGIVLSTIVFSQETEYKLTKDGFTDFIVTQKEGKTASELYTKTLEWVNKTYHTPEKVILGKVENDYFRIQGIKRGLICYAPLGMPVCSDVKYQIEISFKDGKYKFDVSDMEQYSEPSKYSAGGWNTIMANNDTSWYYKKDGTVKGGFSKYIQAVPDYFNSLNKSLSDYISGIGVEIKNNDW